MDAGSPVPRRCALASTGTVKDMSNRLDLGPAMTIPGQRTDAPRPAPARETAEQS
jgi:hypothetical protein